MKLARNFYKNLENAKLNTLNDFLGYKFNYHDALACRNILINIAEKLKSYNIKEILKNLGVIIENVNIQGYKSYSTRGRILKVSNRKALINKEILFENLNY